jgi:hypothetical protein
MGLPPWSDAPDAHHCIMVQVRNGPTEYKCVAGRSAPDGELPSDPATPGSVPVPAPVAQWTADADASRRALTRARFAADGLDPSASAVRLAHQSVGAKRRREEKEFATNIALDNECPIQACPGAGRGSPTG